METPPVTTTQTQDQNASHRLERAQETFALPSRRLNAQGEPRRVGFEFEYAGVPIARSAEMVASLFEGHVEEVNRYFFKVRDTRYGDFNVESDSSLLKERRYETYLKTLGLDPVTSEWGQKLEDLIQSVSADYVPTEIVSPPIHMDRIGCVELLREALRKEGAQGTHAHAFAAFGMQFNPEMPAFDVDTLLAYQRAFFLLFDRLKASTDVPLVRKVLPYIDPFPDTYIRKVLDPEYSPSLSTFMLDYLEENPTRNRPLDWLPLFAYLDPQLVNRFDVEKHLIKPRPTLHYRLPSSLIDDPSWSIAAEWNKWVEIERLAEDPAMLRTMIDEWHAVHGHFELRSEAKWVKRSDELLNGH